MSGSGARAARSLLPWSPAVELHGTRLRRLRTLLLERGLDGGVLHLKNLEEAVLHLEVLRGDVGLGLAHFWAGRQHKVVAETSHFQLFSFGDISSDDIHKKKFLICRNGGVTSGP